MCMTRLRLSPAWRHGLLDFERHTPLTIVRRDTVHGRFGLMDHSANCDRSRPEHLEHLMKS